MRYIGFAFRITDDVEFVLLKVAFHWHKHDDPSECPFRTGLVVGLLGFEIGVGIFSIGE